MASERASPEAQQARPNGLDRYFYFEDMPDQDSLFRYVVRAVLAVEPSRAQKANQLQRLAQRGVFLIDLKLHPKLDGEPLKAYVPDLVARAVELRPCHVITIKASVCELTQEPLRTAGLDVVDEWIPFPGTGQQRRFLERMATALASIGWRP